MRRQQQQWEGKEKKTQVMNFVPYWGYQLNKTCCSLLLSFFPLKKPKRLCTTTTTTTTTHIDRSIFLTFSDSYRHTYIPLFFTSASEWCVCVCIHLRPSLLPSINSSRPIITNSHSIDDINFLSQAHKARMFPPFLLLLTRALLLMLLSPPLIFRFRFSFRIGESAMAFVARD